jgi:LysM repeat protein
MKWINQSAVFFCALLLLINTAAKAQSINGDTIYVDSKTVVAVRFPSLPTNFYTNPPDAPYNLISLPTGFTIIAKKKNTSSADLFVIENKRTHKFIIVNQKLVGNSDIKQTDYDFSTIKKIKDRVKLLEERDKKYNEAIAAADKLYNEEDYENAKTFYTTALGLLNRSWPKDQIQKINKKLKKSKRKKN